MPMAGFQSRCVRGLLCLLLLAPAAGAWAGKETPETVESLVARNEAARAKIKSAQYTTEWKYDYNNGPNEHGHDWAIAHIWRKGDFVLADESYAVVRQEGETLKAFGGAPHVVLNTHCFAWATENEDVYIHPHASATEMSAKEKEAIVNHLPRDPLSYCYGDHSLTLRECLAERPGRFDWRVERAADKGETCYRLVCYDNASGYMRTGAFVIDPARDYNIVRHVVYGQISSGNPPGLGLEKEGIRAEQLNEFENCGGVWFPVRCIRNSYLRAVENPVAAEADSHYVLTVKTKKVNEPIPGDQFAFEKLGFKPRAIFRVFDEKRGVGYHEVRGYHWQ